MIVTKNLGLKLVGTTALESNQTFLEWRSDMNGLGTGSNMQILDAAYGQMQSDIEGMLGTTQEYARYHLGFYLDENGDLCQTEEQADE